VNYEDFLRAKMVAAPERGASIDAADISPILFPHQSAIARWAIQGGRRAIFAAFGSGKTLMQLEIANRLLHQAYWFCAYRAPFIPLGRREG
jgi:hypothetical protein